MAEKSFLSQSIKIGHGILAQARKFRNVGRYRSQSVIVLALMLVLAAAASRLFENRALRSKSLPAHSLVEKAIAPVLPQVKEIVGSFQKNQTVTEVLLHQGLSLDMIQQIIESTRPVYNLAKVKASQLYWLYFTPDGKFRDFRYPVDDQRYLTVYHDATEDRFVPILKDYKFETRLERVSATIESSLFASIVGIGESYDLAMELADIFGSDVDFNTDIQKGDTFQILVEKKYLDGKFSKNGAVLAAEVMNQGKTFAGIRFIDENGKPAYYAPDGKALKRSFLKAPLKVIRISSRFSFARMHPVLKIVRPHLGVDYAAPNGTPVQAVGAGTVVAAGSSGASGKMVKIRHASGYETNYMHLSRIVVRSGTRVSQGDIIGQVGSSGLSTGPHLDFRVYKNGKAINPTKVVFPPGKPISGDRLSQFAELRDSLMDELHSTGAEGKQALLSAIPAR
jgi:murein DD-endopeptidase MepM/ murein hydrolase activator NlpD